MANKVHEIAFKIAGKMAGGFSSTFKTASKTVHEFGQNLNKINEQSAKVDKLIRLKKEVAESAREYAQAKQRVAELGRQMAQTANPTQKMVAEFNRAKNATTNAKNALERKRQTLKETATQYGMTGQSLKQLIQRQNELTASADRARQAQERLNNINSKLAKTSDVQSKLNSGAMSGAAGLTGMAVAATGAVGLPVKEAMAMEDAMAEVRKVTDFTPEGLQQARKEIEMMSTRIPISADGLAKIMASAAQSGVAQENLLAFTEQAAKMGVAFDITAEEAGEMMAKWQSGMGLAQDQTFKLADAVNALSNANAATGAQIGEVLKRYGALGKVSGLNEKQTAAFAASVVASGAEAEVAATGIKAFMRSMSKGGSMSAKQAGAFANVGIDPMELQKNLQKDAPAAIISTLEAIQKSIPKEQWNQYLSVMFGEEAAVAVGPMMTNLEGLKNNFKMVANEAGYTDSMLNEFKARSETTSNALILAKNSALYAARAIGQPLLEPLKQVATEFVQTAIKVGQWVQENKELVMTGLKVAGVLASIYAGMLAMKIAVWAVVSPIMSLYRGYLLLQKAIMLVRSGLIMQKAAMIASKVAMIAGKVVMVAMTVAQWALNAAQYASPHMWLIAGIMALIGVGILLWKYWDQISAAFVAAAQWVWNTYKAYVAWVLGVYKTAFIAAFNAIKKVVTLVWDAISNAAISVWNSLKAFGAYVWGGFKSGITSAWNGIKNTASAVWSAVTGAVSSAWNSIKAFGAYIWGGFKSAFIGAFTGIRDGVAGAFSSLVAIVKGPINAIISMVNKVISAINNIKIDLPEIVGGGSIGFNIPHIPMLASGGIATAPTLAMIGEGNESEAVLPLSKLKTMIGGGTGGGFGGGITINFSPVINVNGGGADAYSQAQRGVEAGAQNLRKELEKVIAEQRRLSYT